MLSLLQTSAVVTRDGEELTVILDWTIEIVDRRVLSVEFCGETWPQEFESSILTEDEVQNNYPTNSAIDELLSV